jgi:hypothetical protein
MGKRLADFEILILDFGLGIGCEGEKTKKLVRLGHGLLLILASPIQNP